MRTFKILLLLLVVALAIAFVNATEPIPLPTSAADTAEATITRRFLRVQHEGVNDQDHEVASDAGIPGYVQAPASAPATISAPVATGNPASVSVPAPLATPASAPQSQLPPTPGSSTTNVNVMPSTVHTTVIVTPGTSTTTVNGAASAPLAIPQSQPQSQPQPRPAPAPVAKPIKPSTSGLGFGNLNPMTSVATLAHEGHGMLVGHTGTTPSAYMKGQSGGGGHGH